MLDISLDSRTACAFTGHRPDKLPASLISLRAALRETILAAVECGYRDFISGMAMGVDMLAAEEVLALREKYPLRLIAALPYRGQGDHFPADQRRRHRQILARADLAQCICDSYTPYCMNGRNRWMVENAGRLIAVFDGSPGGTANTVATARQFMREIVVINPFTGC